MEDKHTSLLGRRCLALILTQLGVPPLLSRKRARGSATKTWLSFAIASTHSIAIGQQSRHMSSYPIHYKVHNSITPEIKSLDFVAVWTILKPRIQIDPTLDFRQDSGFCLTVKASLISETKSPNKTLERINNASATPSSEGTGSSSEPTSERDHESQGRSTLPRLCIYVDLNLVSQRRYARA